MTGHLDTCDWVVAGPLAVRRDGSSVLLGERDIDLTTAQALVLGALLRRGGRFVRREEIYRDVFGRELRPRSRAIDLHIARIRAALGPYAAHIVTVGRVGYRIDVERLRNGSVTKALRDNGP